MSTQYIFTTYKLSRRYPPDREVLTDISLSFLPGAKIGVIGYNGAGKSTLLRIMAGLDTEFDGQAQLASGATAGMLEQEPQLDPARGVPHQGNYSGWLEQKRARLQQEEKQESARKRTIDQELEWVRLNASARRNKPKARLNAYEALLAQDRNVKLDQVQVHIPAGPRLGDTVVEATGLRKAYGDRVLIDDLSFSLPPGGIVGVIGPNGAGKTTLLRMITGQEQPDAGTLRLGDTVQLAYVDQSRDALDPEKTVWQEVSEGQDQIKLGDRTVNSRAYVAGFHFKGTD